jgi:tryptophanyl-tRNA synthetase
MRPTGRLQIGNYFGALQNWVRLQNEVLPSTESVGSSSPLPPPAGHSPLPANDCFYFVADWHALTSDYADTSAIAENTLQVAIDFLAAGLDPNKSVIFQQSQVPEHAELHLLLSMITPLGWLERVPTYKEALENIKNKDLHTYGFLGYPTLQTADIVIYSDPGKPLIVPVGEDQVAHVEMSRELVRRFNFFYAGKMHPDLTPEQTQIARNLIVANLPEGHYEATPAGEVTILLSNARSELGMERYSKMVRDNPEYFSSEALTEPSVLLTPTPRVPGLDGRKMSKSYGNAITLSESDADIRSKTKVMVTDPARKRRTDPGNPDICPVYDWHKLFSPPETLTWAAQGCRTAGIGCIECKSAMADNLIKWITPIRERRLHWESNRKGVLQILDEGSARARESAKQTMARVRESVLGWQSKRRQLL